MANGITDVQLKDLGPVNPAQTDRDTGEVWLNSRLISKYPKEYWEYILKHEEGHIKGNNRSEFVADEYASRAYLAKYPDKPFLSVDALRNVLPMNTPEMTLRVSLQQSRAVKFDCVNNGNQASCEVLKKNDGKMNYTGTTFNLNATDTGHLPASVWEQLRFRINPAFALSKGITDIIIIDKAENPNQDKKLSIGITEITIIERASNGMGDKLSQRVFFSNGNGLKYNKGNSISNFTNCSKYVLKARRENCEAENQRERDAQIKIAELASADKRAVSSTQSDTTKSLASLLASTDLNGSQAMTQQPATTNSKLLPLIIIGLIAAAAVTAIAIFYKDEK